MPRARKTYVLRPDAGVATVFIAHPLHPGLWIRTDASVVVVACPVCNVAVGEPCRGTYRESRDYHGWTHYKRRHAARGKTNNLETIAAIVFDRIKAFEKENR